MKLIAGLGNPEKRYENTPHNVGFIFIDFLAHKLGAEPFSYNKKFDADVTEVNHKGEKLILAKPQTYMNNSGRAISAITQFYKISSTDVMIVHDDLDIVIGEYKIQVKKGPKEHNGISSIEQHLGTNEFMRVRIGVDGREGSRVSGKTYVLTPWGDDLVQKAVNNFNEIYSEVLKILTKSE